MKPNLSTSGLNVSAYMSTDTHMYVCPVHTYMNVYIDIHTHTQLINRKTSPYLTSTDLYVERMLTERSGKGVGSRAVRMRWEMLRWTSI